MTEQLTIESFQGMIKDRYFATDSARGLSKTYLWLAEEQGELAQALGKYDAGDPNMENLAEEFADVLAWIATLANITGVDLTQAIQDKYIKDGGPEGTK
jgi:NTP pyrophosphatase (non-canonical NTP hydrolase)